MTFNIAESVVIDIPDDLDAKKERLDTEAEQENVIEAPDPWVREGRAELTCPDDGVFSTFRDLLKQEEFHLVFLSGHGTFEDNSLELLLNDAFENIQEPLRFIGRRMELRGLCRERTARLPFPALLPGQAIGRGPGRVPGAIEPDKGKLRACIAVEQPLACLNGEERELLNRMRAYCFS